MDSDSVTSGLGGVGRADATLGGPDLLSGACKFSLPETIDLLVEADDGRA